MTVFLRLSYVTVEMEHVITLGNDVFHCLASTATHSVFIGSEFFSAFIERL